MPSVSASPSLVTAGGPVTVQVSSGGPATPTDWVGLYPAASPAETGTWANLTEWRYMNNAQEAPAQPITAAVLSFSPDTPGTYHFRYFANDRAQLLATSNSVTVSLPPAPSPLAMTPVLRDLYSLYSPSVIALGGIKLMWTGGWLTAADPAGYLDAVESGVDPRMIPGADKIFYSDFNGSLWSWPVLSFQKIGYTVNDPTVIQHPVYDWLLMYYTALDNPSTNPLNSGNHVIGLASSIDGGKTWTDHGIVISKEESGDVAGAWSPSAVVAGGERWVFYHTASQNFKRPITFRQRFAANGWQKIGDAERLNFPGAPSVVLLANADVTRLETQYLLLANSLDACNVMRYVSADGLNWTLPPGITHPYLIEGGPNNVFTPCGGTYDSTSYSVYFGFAPEFKSTSIHAWRFPV